MKRTQQGFSLIEILVVITILGALAAGTAVFLQITKRKKAQFITQQRLTSISVELEKVKGATGRYPPTSTSSLKDAAGVKIGQKVGEPNETNIGIETVYIALNMTGMNTDWAGLGEDSLGNVDEDEVGEMIGELKTNFLFEFIDAYGNPFVYFKNNDYKEPGKVEGYVNYKLETVKAAPITEEKTQNFFRRNSYQLFSMGPDGQPNTEDDIVFGRF